MMIMQYIRFEGNVCECGFVFYFFYFSFSLVLTMKMFFFKWRVYLSGLRNSFQNLFSCLMAHCSLSIFDFPFFLFLQNTGKRLEFKIMYDGWVEYYYTLIYAFSNQTPKVNEQATMEKKSANGRWRETEREQGQKKEKLLKDFSFHLVRWYLNI